MNSLTASNNTIALDARANARKDQLYRCPLCVCAVSCLPVAIYSYTQMRLANAQKILIYPNCREIIVLVGRFFALMLFSDSWQCRFFVIVARIFLFFIFFFAVPSHSLVDTSERYIIYESREHNHSKPVIYVFFIFYFFCRASLLNASKP